MVNVFFHYFSKMNSTMNVNLYSMYFFTTPTLPSSAYGGLYRCCAREDDGETCFVFAARVSVCLLAERRSGYARGSNR